MIVICKMNTNNEQSDSLTLTLIYDIMINKTDSNNLTFTCNYEVVGQEKKFTKVRILGLKCSKTHIRAC